PRELCLTHQGAAFHSLDPARARPTPITTTQAPAAGVTSMNRFSALIEQKARDVIEVYWESRARWNPAKSLKNLTAQATQEYENRFLIELIQNAYDAHPAGTRDGGVYIRLNREEEPHGVLYVANRGVPFKKSNFLAITEIAQSDKLLFIPHAL